MKRWMPVTVAAAMVLGACTSGKPGAGTTRSLPDAVPSTSASPGPRLEACDSLPGVLCGSIHVPLDRASPSGPSIPIEFFVHRHTEEPAGTPIFAIPGGPGSNGLDAMGFALTIDSVTANHDVIAISPRGTGGSGAIDCPDLQNGWSGPRAQDVAVAACGRHLGDASDRYGSGDIALDIDAVRRALGYNRMDIYAESYGTVPAQAYAARFPRRIEAMVLDAGMSVTDPAHTFAWDLGVPAALVRAVALMCSREPTCHVENPAAAITRLVRLVGAKPIRGRLQQPGGQSANATVDQIELASLLQSTGTCSVCGQIDPATTVTSFAQAGRDPKPLLQLASTNPVTTDSGPDSSDFSAGANLATFCNDQNFVWNRNDPIPVRERKYRAALAALPPSAFAPFSKASWTRYLPEGCLMWPAPHRFVPAVPPNTQFPAVPTLILAGDSDVQVPPVVVETLRDEFPHATFVTIAGAGHPVIGPAWGHCAANLVGQLFNSLQIKDSSCAKTT